MREIGLRELKTQASNILRHVREEGESFEIRHRGRAIARLVPVVQPKASTATEDFWGALIQVVLP